MGSYFRGRPMRWDPDAQAIEQERQKWVYERVSRVGELIEELAVDPAREYQAHREAYVETGSAAELARMLEYVR